MRKNIFKLTKQQLKDVALALQVKVEKGLEEEGREIACLPTYIHPKTDHINGSAVVLDLGGTNYRVGTVSFKDNQPTIHPEDGWKKDLSEMKSPGFTQAELYRELSDPILEIKRDEELPVGYCFSYPAESLPDGDARLLHWVKGVDIKEMVGQSVGKSLLDYLNKISEVKFSGIHVINDTVASLFAGLTEKGYDAYIGLIVGTGNNMATFIDSEKIPKLKGKSNFTGMIPVNLESGNFYPPHLTPVDDTVDACSDSRGVHRFEKAVSGMYLGEILKTVFPFDEFEEKFDAQKLTTIISYPDLHKKRYVRVARWIYVRSAKLVAASLVGLILVLLSKDENIKNIRLMAEGSLFWSENRHGKNYKQMVMENLKCLLCEFGHYDVKVNIGKIENANLIGTAIAALS